MKMRFFLPWLCLAPAEAACNLALSTCSFLLFVIKQSAHQTIDLLCQSSPPLFKEGFIFHRLTFFNLKEMNKTTGESPPALSSLALLIISAEISDIYAVSVNAVSSNGRGETAFLGCETAWVQDPAGLSFGQIHGAEEVDLDGAGMPSGSIPAVMGAGCELAASEQRRLSSFPFLGWPFPLLGVLLKVLGFAIRSRSHRIHSDSDFCPVLWGQRGCL